MRSRMVAATAAGMAVLLAPLVGVLPADAVVVDSGTETEHVDFNVRRFCDVRGLRVNIAGTNQFRWRATPHGPDGIPYYVQQVRARTVYTNRANGAYVTEVVRTTERDQTITNNGETFTIEVLATGAAYVKDSDGKLIAANPGQIRFEILIDHNGTPKDPSDDEFLEFLEVTRESTGRSDDFCANVVPALT